MALPDYQISCKSTNRFKIYPKIFIPEDSNSFRSFMPYRKLLPLVSMVSLPLYHFCPTVNYMPWLRQLHQLKMVCDVTTTTQQRYIKKSKPNVEQDSPQNFELRPF
jgi:hypothetical protein